MKQPDEITLAQGNGGQGMQQLIEGLFLKAFDNPLLNEKEDQARIALADLTAQGDRLAFSTDSYVIDPIIFPIFLLVVRFLVIFHVVLFWKKGFLLKP